MFGDHVLAFCYIHIFLAVYFQQNILSKKPTLSRGGPTASRDSCEIAFAFHVCIQKFIEERFPDVPTPLEVQAWVLYCISAMRCEDD